jgi:hypothetical protein
MNNVIDSIKLSGVTYGIKGSGGTETIELTQAQYDALVDKDPNTFYVITDAQAGDLTNYYTKSETNTLLNGKQATLVSGTNIKTINNESILGSGNIDIQGGGVDVVQTTGTSTTDVMSQDAVTTQLNGKQDSSKLPTYIVSDVIFNTNQVAVNRTLKSNGGQTRSTNNVITINNQAIFNNSNLTNLSLVETSAITTTVSSSSTDAQVPSAKAVYDAIQEGGGGSSYTAGDGIDITNNVISVTGKVDTTTYNTYTAATDTALASKQTTLTAGTGISIVDNVISATGGGGGGGMTEDDELLISTALTDLNDRKIDASEVKSQLGNYQKKGDYVTTSTLNTRLAEYETALDEQNVEEVTAYALNDLNNKFGGLKLVKITESEYAALTTKDENTLYIVVADPS